MPSVIINNENHIPNKFRGSFKPLVEKINGLASVSICKHLSGGFSESVPYWSIQPMNILVLTRSLRLAREI